MDLGAELGTGNDGDVVTGVDVVVGVAGGEEIEADGEGVGGKGGGVEFVHFGFEFLDLG